MKVYLDYAATTPVDPRVAEKMWHYLTPTGCFANPSSTHMSGRAAAAAIEQAREQVAQLVNTDANAIFWTSCATEGNNLAIKGAAYYYRNKGQHLVTCLTEHESVIEPYKQLEKEGFAVTYLKPESTGLLAVDTLQAALRSDTILVSLMQVNNEIGVVQDIATLGSLLRDRGILFHVDAAQSAGKIPIDLQQLPVDLMVFSAHKIYGPKGIGALYIRQKPRVNLIPQMHGGGQEQGLRSGTLPTHQIIGMGEAFAIAGQEMPIESLRILRLREKLWYGLKTLGGVYQHGDEKARVAGILNISFEQVDSTLLLPALKDLAVSAGSACQANSLEPSHVLRAIGVPATLIHNSIRFSIGRFTTEEEVDFVIKKVSEVVNFLRGL